jgi:hypothetical protein
MRMGAAVMAAAAMLAPIASASGPPCSPLAAQTCGAPFPSDLWTAADAASPTGRRTAVPDAVLRPELLAQLPSEDGMAPSAIFDGASGFSAGAGVVFELAGAHTPPPVDGGEIVVAHDLATGARLPVEVLHDRGAGGDPSAVLRVFPRTRWPYAHRVLVAVATTGDGAPDVAGIAADTARGTPAARYMDDVAGALRQVGLDPARTRTATVFTVRDRAEVVGAMQRLFDDTAGRPHPVRDVRLNSSLASTAIAGVVTGRVRVDNYRTDDGRGPVDFSGATRRDQWVPFQLTLPRSAQTRPAPVVIYQHGLGVTKETDVLVSTMNAQLGLATISIDWPNHGIRAAADGGRIDDLWRPDRLGAAAGFFEQGTPDLAGLYTAIGGLRLDVLRRPTLANPAGRGADGRPDLDTGSISMQGTSMGGLLGTNFAALAPKLDVLIFHVAGQNFARWFATSSLWAPTPCRTAGCRTQIGEMLPAGRTQAEDAVLIDMFAHRIDPADAVNTVDFIRYPRAGQARKPMQMIVGIGDTTVPEATSAITARLLDIPLTGPDLAALPGVRRAADADPDGYELTLHRPFPGGALGRLTSPLTRDGSHYAFGHQSAFRDQQRFLRRFGPVR